MPLVFEEMNSFGFVHHRALNSREKYDSELVTIDARPDLTHVFEGDICWNVTSGRDDFYFRHPTLLWDTLSEDQIDEAREAGQLFLLDDLIEIADPRLRFIIELKVGKGDVGEAMRRLAVRLQDGLKDRYWIDGFSTRLMRLVKSADSGVPTSIHTKGVYGSRVCRTAPEFFPLSFPRLRSLHCVDVITATYKTSSARYFRRFGATIDGTFRAVREAGKTLVLGGVTSPEYFELARNSMARAAYAKFSLSELPTS
ncbi:MAG: hypothetical protein CMJ78_21690 [Planctomycetaceae bacterium]|nr:hypothetical protein [Planctomycetaceae bacterium]